MSKIIYKGKKTANANQSDAESEVTTAEEPVAEVAETAAENPAPPAEEVVAANDGDKPAPPPKPTRIKSEKAKNEVETDENPKPVRKTSTRAKTAKPKTDEAEENAAVAEEAVEQANTEPVAEAQETADEAAVSVAVDEEDASEKFEPYADEVKDAPEETFDKAKIRIRNIPSRTRAFLSGISARSSTFYALSHLYSCCLRV